MAKIDGGPAFPTHGGHHPDDDPRNHTLGGGMTLRDWFAGQAPVQLGDVARMLGWPPEFNLTQDSERAALWAIMTRLRYEYADAMITARSIKGDDNG